MIKKIEFNIYKSGIAIFIIMLGIIQGAFATTSDEIAKAWKERGFVALSRIDSYAGGDDIKARYEYLLEYAFAMHATINKSDKFAFVHKTEAGLDFYKLILNKGESKKPVRGGDAAGLF